MFLHKQLIVNSIKVKDYPFNKEISMAAYIVENPNILSLGNDWGEVTIIDYEVSLESNRRIDIVAAYEQDYIAIVELKLDDINDKTINQIGDYIQEGKQNLPEKYKNQFGDNKPKLLGIMVGKDIDPNVAMRLRTEGVYSQKDIPIAALTMKRYKGDDGQVYVIIDTYFPEKVRGKDYTKYLFNGDTYNKGRLIHAVVSKYLQANPDTTFAQLKTIFPDNLQGSLGVFEAKKAAEDKQGSYKRYYTGPEDLILTGDGGPIAVCTQWGIGNIGKFINKAKELKYEIKEAT